MNANITTSPKIMILDNNRTPVNRWAVLICITVFIAELLFGFFTFPVITSVYLSPLFRVILLLVQIMCLLTVAKNLADHAPKLKLLVWLIRIGSILIFAYSFRFLPYLPTASVDGGYWSYKFVQPGRTYILIEDGTFSGCFTSLLSDRRCGLYNLIMCDNLELVCTAAVIDHKVDDFGRMAVPIIGTQPAHRAPRDFPILRESNGTIQIVSNITEDGTVVPAGVAIYNSIPLGVRFFTNPIVSVLALAAGVGIYFARKRKYTQ